MLMLNTQQAPATLAKEPMLQRSHLLLPEKKKHYIYEQVFHTCTGREILCEEEKMWQEEKEEASKQARTQNYGIFRGSTTFS